jgi:hypothetical protein
MNIYSAIGMFEIELRDRISRLSVVVSRLALLTDLQVGKIIEQTYQSAYPIHPANTHGKKPPQALGIPVRITTVSILSPCHPQHTKNENRSKKRNLTSQLIASPATALTPSSHNHSNSSKLASTPACCGVFNSAYARFCSSLKESHSGITPMRMNRISPLRNCVFCALRMVLRVARETECVEKLLNSMGGVCEVQWWW